MPEDFYFQVELSRTLPEGTTKQIAWIPAQYARYGQYLCINGENGWLVENVYMRGPGETLRQKENVYDRNAFLCFEG